MIFDNRISKAVAAFVDYDRSFRQFANVVKLTGSEDGNHIYIKNGGTLFKAITKEEWENLASGHKRALINTNVYSWNNYTVYGFLGEQGLLEDFMKCASTSTN